MKFIQLPIEQATDEQLAAYAQSLDLPVPPDPSRGALAAILNGPAWGKPFILVPEPVEPIDGQVVVPVVEPQQRMEGGIGADDPKVILTINKTEMPGGKDPVAVSHNGRALVIQRGLKVELPYRYYLALKDAIRAEVSQDDRTGEITESDISNYPMTVHTMPAPELIAAWFDRTKDELMPN